MRDQARLSGLEIVGRHAQQRPGAGLFGRPREFDSGLRIVAAGAGDHRNAPACRGDRRFDDTQVLARREQRGLAGRAARHQGRGAGVDLAMAERLERLEIDGAVAERRRQCHARTMNPELSLAHDTSPYAVSARRGWMASMSRLAT